MSSRPLWMMAVLQMPPVEASLPTANSKSKGSPVDARLAVVKAQQWDQLVAPVLVLVGYVVGLRLDADLTPWFSR
eukprot:2530428-Pyramimonas_sp.AAC.2